MIVSPITQGVIQFLVDQYNYFDMRDLPCTVELFFRQYSMKLCEFFTCICKLVFNIYTTIIVVMCEELPAIIDGAVTFHKDMEAPYDGLTVAMYSCDLGYILSGGDQVRICESILVGGELVGRWTGSEPTCESTLEHKSKICDL